MSNRHQILLICDGFHIDEPAIPVFTLADQPAREGEPRPGPVWIRGLADRVEFEVGKTYRLTVEDVPEAEGSEWEEDL